jgi:hypothetical protein
MNYEKTLIELMERVLGLEERVDTLESKASNESAKPKVESLFEKESTYTRTEARAIYMRQFEETLNAAGYKNIRVFKANREQGSGILIDGDDLKRPVRVKFYFSKTYGDFSHKGDPDKVTEAMGWFSTDFSELNRRDIDVVVFCMPYINDDETFFDFIFNTKDLLAYKKAHRSDDGDKLHLYLTSEMTSCEYSAGGDPDFYAFDRREGRIDVSEHLNESRYGAFGEFLKDNGRGFRESYASIVPRYKSVYADKDGGSNE